MAVPCFELENDATVFDQKFSSYLSSFCSYIVTLKSIHSNIYSRFAKSSLILKVLHGNKAHSYQYHLEEFQ